MMTMIASYMPAISALIILYALHRILS